MATKVIWHGEKIKQEYMTAIPKALMIMGAQANTFVKEKTPVDTGLLRSSITFATSVGQSAPTTEKGTVAGRDDIIGQPEDRFELKIGTNVHYAPHIEYGTVKMKGHSFLRDGILSNQKRLGSIYGGALRGLVK